MKIVLFVFLFMATCGQAFSFSDEEAVRCIMGEARGEPFLGKVAVGEALRNRGTLDGVYGCRAKFSEPERVWNEARRAWVESERSSLVSGATHWESTDFKTPYWAAKMIQTALIGKQRFFK